MTRLTKIAPERAPDLKLEWQLQFFVSKDATEPLGSIQVVDRRLDRSLLDALDSHPAFNWNEELNGYIVDLSLANPPHLVNVRKPAEQREPRGDKNEEAPAPARSFNIGLTSNPKWQGKGSDNYSSRFGWRLEFVQDRGEEKLPRGDRGKHWKLTHEKSGKEIWFPRKNQVTAYIEQGSAAKFFNDM